MRLRQTGAPVSSIFGLSAIVPQDDLPETRGYADAMHELLWTPGLGLLPRWRASGASPRPDRATRPRGSLRPHRVLLLLGDGCAGRPSRRASARRAVVAAPVRHLGRRVRPGARPPPAEVPERRCSSPSTASAPTDDEQRAAYIAAWARGHPRRDRARRSTCAASSTGPPSTTTSGCTGTTSRSGSSTATGTCARAPACFGERRSGRERRAAAIPRRPVVVCPTIRPCTNRPLWCRGNVGEVFPNVMTPLTFSLYFEAIGRGQESVRTRVGTRDREAARRVRSGRTRGRQGCSAAISTAT